jgi:hypothetical protein
VVIAMNDLPRIPVYALPGNAATEPVVQFDPAKLITLAKALKDEIEAQGYAMNAVADTEAYDDAMQLTDHLATLIAHMTADLEGETLADQRSGYCGERAAGE